MGMPGVWQFLRRKGYEALVILQRPFTSSTPSSPYLPSTDPSNVPAPDLNPTTSGASEANPRRLVDVLGCVYTRIRWAYSTLPMDLAHAAVEKVLRLFADPSNSILYLDGSVALEKLDTHLRREKARQKALSIADECTNKLLDRIKQGKHIGKQDF
ncbi:hypothetical protein BGX28_004788, partial [Mortierella sp. GBA30]